MQGDRSRSPSKLRFTSLGTSVLDFHPPKAVPFQTLPVTSWKGRVANSFPAQATPITQLQPHPLCATSRAMRMTLVLPVQSKVKSQPHLCSFSRFSLSASSDKIQWVAPMASAALNFLGLRSTPIMGLAPTYLAIWITESPTAPSPNTTTEFLLPTLQLLTTAPHPVETPQPIRDPSSCGIPGFILAADISAITVNQAKVEQPMKWYITLPSLENLEVPSGMSPCPWVARIFGQRLVLLELQKIHSLSLHSGVQQGITRSPGTKETTPSPTDSTTAVASWPRMQGNLPSESQPSRVQRSVWQSELDSTFTLTSPRRGGCSYTSVTSKGVLGAQRTAALHLIADMIC